MTESCPIHPDLVDDRATRIGAGLVLLTAAGILAGGRAWPAVLLAADFALRSQGWSRSSPIAFLARLLRERSGRAARPVNAGPKRFAALVGASFSLGIALAFALDHPFTARGLGLVLLACAGLEAFLGFCVGCKVFTLLQGLRPLGRRAFGRV